MTAKRVEKNKHLAYVLRPGAACLLIINIVVSTKKSYNYYVLSFHVCVVPRERRADRCNVWACSAPVTSRPGLQHRILPPCDVLVEVQVVADFETFLFLLNTSSQLLHVLCGKQRNRPRTK